MKLVVFSAPESYPDESLLVNSFFETGLEIFHLRKPGWDIGQYSAFLKNIHPVYLKRIMIHQHYSLTGKYNLRGIHFTRKAIDHAGEELKSLMKQARSRGLQVSRSIHSMEELGDPIKAYDYLLMSPVFESISKPADKPLVALSVISETIREKGINKLFALGGIDEDKLQEAYQAGFSGVAMLGAIWQAEDPVAKVKKIVTKLRSLA